MSEVDEIRDGLRDFALGLGADNIGSLVSRTTKARRPHG